MKAICECDFNSYKRPNHNDLSNNVIYQSQIGQIEEMISHTNIGIIKCYKDIFKYKYFISNTGGFIILGLILIQIIITIIYSWKSLYIIRKYIFSITNKYLLYLSSLQNANLLSNNSLALNANNFIKNSPPNKHKKYKRKYKKSLNNLNNNNLNISSNKEKEEISNNNISNHKNSNYSINSSNCQINLSNEKIKNQHQDKNNNLMILSNNSLNTSKDGKSKSKPRAIKPKYKTHIKKKKKIFEDNLNLSNAPINNFKLSKENIYKNGLFINLKDDININIDMVEYIKTEIDDMDYDDAIRKDKRKICNYFCDKIKVNQILLNTFFYEEPIKPKSLKIILLLIQIDLYFFVNGLFFNEEYVSQIFHLQKDTFFEKFQRFIGNFFYAALVGVIVSYIIEFFFIDEKKIKGIFKREKDNLVVLKYEIVQITKNIKYRYLFFIILSYMITIFTWYHISCFNNIYPHMKKEWIIFSIITIILMQIFYIIVCLLESIIRFISFKFKSEKIYKISLLLS